MKKGFYSTKELAAFLGVSVSTINRMIQEGKIPCYQIGREYRFKIDEINKWLRAQKVA